MSVFIIAEIGSNHGGSLDRALALIDAAADAGADAAKFQRFRVDNFLVPRENPESLRRYELPDEWLPALTKKCVVREIEFMCTAFDLESLDVIDPFVKRHKVGSYEAAKPDYVRAVLMKKKWALVSNGKLAYPFSTTAGYNSSKILPMHCISAYPAHIEHYLGALPRDREWGVSDHTLHPTIVPAAAVALGACVVEKHMRIRAFDEIPLPPDWPVSIDEEQFAQLVEAVRLTEKAVGR